MINNIGTLVTITENQISRENDKKIFRTISAINVKFSKKKSLREILNIGPSIEQFIGFLLGAKFKIPIYNLKATINHGIDVDIMNRGMLEVEDID